MIYIYIYTYCNHPKMMSPVGAGRQAAGVRRGQATSLSGRRFGLQEAWKPGMKPNRLPEDTRR